ncbi:efflux RND transporter periplasmic adaptor subunit [Tepidibacter formicigenes]|uniref:RND family efflux transporter, MFP subunit n=1 Tax=Tepidibacter formicigenes DSM 15518 TaxID=1123349 RepID=A0A1M6M2A3_9FIRM|nr:efflux RND transporter periplasmic adaptor subunit [Tepidibacter formicigenes]SHJ77568.1 RND family efflux transporter, MFP subunit [Tepidibacter formicigenes DSM 15518]
MRKKKLLIITTSILAILILGGVYISTGVKSSKKDRIVTTAEVQKQDISSNILVKGKLESKSKSEISSDLSYRVNEIFVKVGDKVKKGDKLATFDMKELNQDIESAKLELEIQEAQYKEKNSEEHILSLQKDVENQTMDFETAKNKYESSKELYELGSISKDELDSDYNTYKKAQNNLDKIKADLNKAIREKNNDSDAKSLELKRLNLKQKIDDLSKSTIISPIDGTVTAIDAKIGSIPKGAGGLFVIEDLTKLKATFDINEFDINKLHIGQDVNLTTESLNDKVFKGKITNIYPTARIKEGSASGKQIVIPVEVDLVGDVKGLRPGLVIESNIETQKQEGALTVPYEAIYEKPDKTNCVFLVKNGVLKEVPIEIGIQSDLVVQVISKDIKPGDKVALNPNETFSDGMKINIME